MKSDEVSVQRDLFSPKKFWRHKRCCIILAIILSYKQYIMQGSNEMEGFGELVEVQVNQQKCQESGFQQQIHQQKQKKSRAAKKRQKLLQRQKLYETPQAKKQRRKATKDRVKAKQQQQVKGMTKQEAIEYISLKKQQKQALKEKMLKAQQNGLSIFIDCAYESQMNQKQRRSLGVQVELIYKGMRKVQNPCSLRLCSVSGSIEASLKKMGLINLPFGIHKQDVVEIGKRLEKELIYLSPDAPQQLKDVSDSCAYIIGGLVDRTILKNASLNRANQLGIKAYSLPIQPFMIKRKCLNLDHVALILVYAQKSGNWKDAFYSSAPKRYCKQEGGQDKESDSDQPSQKEQIQQQNDSSQDD